MTCAPAATPRSSFTSTKTREHGCSRCCAACSRWRSGTHLAETLVLARDRLGQKPLVYRHDGRRLVFASELKALLALPESTVPRRLDPLALDHYLCYGYVPAPRTILEGIAQASPGSLCGLARRCARDRALLEP